MKKLFKNLIVSAVLAVSVLAFAPEASAQRYGTTSIIDGGTNNVATTATNTYNKLIVAEKATDVGLEISFKGTGADTGNVTVVLQRSLDNSTWSTLTQRYTVAATGTTTATLTTNVTVGAVGYLRVSTVENACSNPITNLTVRYSLKP